VSDTAPAFGLTFKAREGALDETAIRNRKIIYDLYAETNGAGIFDLLADDVVFRQAPSLPYGAELHGIEAAKEGFANVIGAWASLQVEVEELVAAGDLVIAYMMLEGVGKATGKSYSGPTAEVFRMRDGKIIEWRPLYWDTHAVRLACGPGEGD
jgi:uncharacterized protein